MQCFSGVQLHYFGGIASGSFFIFHTFSLVAIAHATDTASNAKNYQAHLQNSSIGTWINADTFTGVLQRNDTGTGASAMFTTGLYAPTPDMPNVNTHHSIHPNGK